MHYVRQYMRFAVATILLALSMVAGASAQLRTSNYRSIDSLASRIAASPNVTVNSAVRSLAELCKTDVQRARAAYSFTASYLLYSPTEVASEPLTPDAPLSSVFGGKGMCGEYAALFNAVAAGLGLESVTVIGVAKGDGYLVGDSANNFGHAWNAVQVDGQWRLLDCAWGSGLLAPPDGGVQPDYRPQITE